MAGGLIDVAFSSRDMRALERTLRAVPKALPRVMSRSLNKTATTVRAETSRSLAKQAKMKVTVVKKAIAFKKATFRVWVAILNVFGNRIPLIQFKAKPSGTGVSYSIGQKFIPGGFIQTMPTGHVGVFKRKGEANNPFAEKFGPSLGVMLEDSPALLKKATDGAGALLEKNIDTQVKLVLAKGR